VSEAILAANRAIGRRVLLAIWPTSFMRPTMSIHVSRGPEPAQVRGPDGIKQAVLLFRRAIPDLQYTVEEEMAERDLVMTRFSARGTNRGSFLGAPPTGRVVSYTGFDLNRIANGKIVESWVNYDALSLLQQVGLVPGVKGL
jgi:predicted ester cyclase